MQRTIEQLRLYELQPAAGTMTDGMKRIEPLLEPIDAALRHPNPPVGNTSFQDDFGPWDDRNQVIEFIAGDDFPVQTEAYDHFRFVTFDTENNPAGAFFQVSEVEYLGEPGPGVTPGPPAN